MAISHIYYNLCVYKIFALVAFASATATATTVDTCANKFYGIEVCAYDGIRRKISVHVRDGDRKIHHQKQYKRVSI